MLPVVRLNSVQLVSLWYEFSFYLSVDMHNVCTHIQIVNNLYQYTYIHFYNYNARFNFGLTSTHTLYVTVVNIDIVNTDVANILRIMMNKKPPKSH